MKGISKSLIRNVGTPAAVTWDGQSTPRIRAIKDASNAALLTGDNFKVRKDGVVHTVTAAGGETGVAAYVTLINTAVGSTAAYNASGRLEVRGSTAIAIEDMGDSVLFAKIGLGNAERLPAAAQQEIFAPVSIFKSSTLAPDDDNLIELLSNAVTVPAGANMCTVDVGVYGAKNVAVDLCLRAGTSAIPGGSWASLFDGVTVPFLDSPTTEAGELPIVRQDAGLGVVRACTAKAAQTHWTSFDFSLGAHRTELRVALLRAVTTSTGALTYDAPKVKARISFGVR